MTKAQRNLYEEIKKLGVAYIEDSRRFKTVLSLVDMGLIKKRVVQELRSVTMICTMPKIEN